MAAAISCDCCFFALALPLILLLLVTLLILLLLLLVLLLLLLLVAALTAAGDLSGAGFAAVASLLLVVTGGRFSWAVDGGAAVPLVTILTFQARKLLKIDCCSWRFLLGDTLVRWFFRRLGADAFAAAGPAVDFAEVVDFLPAPVIVTLGGAGAATTLPFDCGSTLGVPFWDGTMFSTF